MFPTLHRIFFKLLAPLYRQWDLENGRADDTASKGVESEFALYVRQIEIEQATHLGYYFAQVSVDIAKYYDSIDPSVLSDDLIRQDFPPELVALALQGHFIPRRICLGSTVCPLIGYFLEALLLGVPLLLVLPGPKLTQCYSILE